MHEWKNMPSKEHRKTNAARLWPQTNTVNPMLLPTSLITQISYSVGCGLNKSGADHRREHSLRVFISKRRTGMAKCPSWDLSTWFICCGFLWFGGVLCFSPYSREGGAALLQDWAYRQSGQGSVKIIQEARPFLCLSLCVPLAVNEEMDILMRTMQLDSALELWLYL